jgi:tetratricopeptide (TPR) repeat protein
MMNRITTPSRSVKRNTLAFFLLLAGGAGVCVCMTPTHTAAQEPAIPSSPPAQGLEERIGRARELYLEGSLGDKEAVEHAASLIEAILSEDPDNAEVIALQGATMTLKARDTFWPGKKVKITREAITLMDRAVTLAPDATEPRWIRASNNVHFPDFLERLPVALSDLEILWKKGEESPGDFTCERRQKTGRLLGMALWRSEREDEARTIWEKARALDPESGESHAILALEEELSKPEPESVLGPARLRR